MAGTVFSRALRNARRGILGWGGIIALLAVLTCAIYPSISGFEGIDDYLDALPDVFMAMFGDIDPGDFTSPPGFVSMEFFSYMPVVLAVYAVMSGVRAVAGEERRGTMDLLMSTPVSRRRVIIEKFAAFTVALLGILSITFIGLMVGILVVPALEIAANRLLEGTLNMLPITLFFAALSFFISAALPIHYSTGSIVAAFLAISYLTNALAEFSAVLQPLLVINPFHYYGSRTMFDGINWENAAVLLMVSGGLLAASVYSFEQRDLTV